MESPSFISGLTLRSLPQFRASSFLTGVIITLLICLSASQSSLYSATTGSFNTSGFCLHFTVLNYSSQACLKSFSVSLAFGIEFKLSIMAFSVLPSPVSNTLSPLSIIFSLITALLRDFSGGPVGKTPRAQCRGPCFDPWLGN